MKDALANTRESLAAALQDQEPHPWSAYMISVPVEEALALVALLKSAKSSASELAKLPTLQSGDTLVLPDGTRLLAYKVDEWFIELSEARKCSWPTPRPLLEAAIRGGAVIVKGGA